MIPEIAHIRNIAIFRALQLGDLLCSIPAVRTLKSHIPHAEIQLVGLPATRSLISRFSHYFSGFIEFPGYPGLPEQPYDVRSIVDFIRYMQDQKFDLIIQMQGNGTKVNQLMELLGARYTAGYYTPGDYKPPGNLYMPYPDFGHETERHLSLMNFLGIPGGSTDLEFPLTEADRKAYETLGFHSEARSYVCIHPGSRGSWRQWPAENFASIADICAETGLTPVITGTDDEIVIVNEVVRHMNTSPFIAAGKTNLGAMAVLLSNASALVSNCTGVSHIASALNLPGIIISMDGEPHRWGPLNKNNLVTIDWLHDNDFKKVRSTFLHILNDIRGKRPAA